MSILIQHDYCPISFLLKDSSITNDEDDDNNCSPIIHCQLSSNSFFYSTFLSQLSSVSLFAKKIYRLLIEFTRSKHIFSYRELLKPVFLAVKYRQSTRIHLNVYKNIYQFDEWINRRWASIQLHVLVKRMNYESSWAWLSTLGGGHSCLGEESSEHAKQAESISKNQIRLSIEIGDPNALVKSYLFLSLSYLQQKRYDEVRTILRFQYRRIQYKDITDDRLRIMCIALWKKMKYAIKTDKNRDF